jgi:hypothetical protein
MTGALILHPTTSKAALGLLSCREAPVTVNELDSLDGGDKYRPAAVSSLRDLIMVPLLTSDPKFVCFSGSHMPAGWLAVASIIVYVGALPLVVLAWLWFDARLRIDRAAASDKVAPGPDASSAAVASPCVNSPRYPAKPDEGSDVADASAIVLPHHDPLLNPFLADSSYSPRFWFLRLVDILMVFTLAALQVCKGRGSV